MDGVNSGRRGLLFPLLYFLLLLVAGSGEAARVKQGLKEGLDIAEVSGICFGACLHGRLLGRRPDGYGGRGPDDHHTPAGSFSVSDNMEIKPAHPPLIQSTETPPEVDTPLAPPSVS